MGIFNRLLTPSDAAACIAMAGILGGCAAAKPACGIIRIADEACEIYMVEYTDEDGKKVQERVPKHELRMAAARSRRARLARESKTGLK